MAKAPTHSEVTRLISSYLPPKKADVPLLFYVPRNPSYNFDVAPVEQVVLSVTASPQVYDAIGFPQASVSARPTGNRQLIAETRPLNTICFLHRPWGLETKRIRDNALVLASHSAFDENLTVGWNPALAARIGLDVPNCVCVDGYKGSEERKIGMIGRVPSILGLVLRIIEEEFGEIEHAQEGLSEEIQVIAIMNAFGADDVQRVVDVAQDQQWVPADAEHPGKHVLYLTGQPQDSGLEEANLLGMTVVCIGRRVAEQWGIEFLGKQIREAYPMVPVKEIYEDGDPLPN